MTNWSYYKEFGNIFYAVCHQLGFKGARCFSLCKTLLSNGIGLEIGGPSPIFTDGGILPIYTVLKRIDNSNFSENTIWGSISEDKTFYYDKAKVGGKQYVSDATELKPIPSAIYDCVLSSHVIEHIANPLKAFHEWSRVLKEMGIMVLVVPHKDGTFDHRRPITSFDHILSDFQKGTTEDDQTHLPEILELHDIKRDPAAGTLESFKKRSENNCENRALHQHVFDTELVVRIVNFMKFKIFAVKPILPFHIIVIAQKLPAGQFPDNKLIIENIRKQRRCSPFISDRRSSGNAAWPIS